MSRAMLDQILVNFGADLSCISIGCLKSLFYMGRYPLTHDHLMSLLEMPVKPGSESLWISEDLAERLMLNPYQIKTANDMLNEDK